MESLGMAVQEQESITYPSPMHDGHEILLKGVQDVCCRAENWTQIIRVQDCHTAKTPDGSLLLLL